MFCSPDEHQQRKQALLNRFGDEIEKIMATTPDLVPKGPSPAEETTSTDAQQLEYLLRKKGIIEGAGGGGALPAPPAPVPSVSAGAGSSPTADGPMDAGLAKLLSMRRSPSSDGRGTPPPVATCGEAAPVPVSAAAGLGATDSASQLEMLLAKRGIGAGGRQVVAGPSAAAVPYVNPPAFPAQTVGPAAPGPTGTGTPILNQLQQMEGVLQAVKQTCATLEHDNQSLREQLADALGRATRAEERANLLAAANEALRQDTQRQAAAAAAAAPATTAPSLTTASEPNQPSPQPDPPVPEGS
eukprot:NODE_740_length_1201_cov_79.889757_g530_i0.p1 GENE.NODE_740_length_1201_cov_79.889757_g530_i0~~NODE_740_length_1201_cov_79.889757_g530_i0.p1  ORF type:complete len:299 (+),score=87.13 NODE_740_length_1201_cov_79.889757_g530_i0:120-1016(+)